MNLSSRLFPFLAVFVCTVAHAQSSVTLYGDLDVGVQYLTHAGSNGGSALGLQSGNEQPSRYGFIGAEDLGNGYSAIFRLEGGINLTNGQYVVANTPFNRYAYVGIANQTFGTVTLGRQLSLLFEQSIAYDPTGLAQYSAMSTNFIPVSSFAQNNAIKWTTPTIAGVSGAVMYSFGQQIAGNSRAGRFVSGVLSYDRNSFGAHVIYEESHGPLTTGSDLSSEVDRRVNAALRYSIGAATLYAGYTNVSGGLHYSPPGYTYYGGARYMASPALALVGEVAHYRTTNDQGQPTWFIAGATYSLSKRTSIYAYGGILNNHGGSSFTLNTYDFSSPGGFNQTGVQIGLNQLF